MSTKYRAQILLEPEQHQALAKIAHQEGRSISEVVRGAVNQLISERLDTELVRQRLEALDRIATHHQAILEHRGGKPLELDVVEIIRQMREERADELLGNTFGRSD